MKLRSFAAAATLALFTSSPVVAATLNGTGLLTSEVIMGSGITNGSWTGASGGGIEVALRGKLRYDALGNPKNIFNYDEDRTYTFDPTKSLIPAGQTVFNFEFSVNSDVFGTTHRNVNDITWSLAVDVDPTAAIANIFSGDMINVPIADHSFGTNSTAQSGGAEAANDMDFGGYNLLRASNNVVQNSFNYGAIPNPHGPGIYTISLFGSDSTGVLASTSIDIVVAPSPVPLPAGLPMLAAALGLVGALRYRRKT